MPTYEYKCTSEACDHHWEEDQKMNDPKSTICPKCKEETAQRLISRSSFVLKGSGWFNSGGY